jgi:hypothetical protein
MPSFPILRAAVARPVRGMADTTTFLGRSEARRTVTVVPLWKTNTIDIPSGQRYEVRTYGPGCAITVAILSKHGDGTRSVTLSSYPPIAVDHQLADLDLALKTTSHAAGNPGVLHEAFLVAPSDWEQDAEGKWILSENHQEIISLIDKAIQTHLPETKPKMLPFPSSLRFGESRTFALQIPSEPHRPIRYQGVDRGVCSF